MKVLKELNTERYGNDCLIKASIALLEFSNTNYMVISTEQFIGSWTDNAISTSTWEFKNYDAAYSKYDQIAGGMYT